MSEYFYGVVSVWGGLNVAACLAYYFGSRNWYPFISLIMATFTSPFVVAGIAHLVSQWVAFGIVAIVVSGLTLAAFIRDGMITR